MVVTCFFIPSTTVLHLWVKPCFNHSRQMLLFWKKKWWIKVCVVFFLLMGKESDSCNNVSPAWKRQHFVPVFVVDLELILREKNVFFFLFGCLLLHKEKKMRKFETTFASFEKATNQLTILNPFFTQRARESHNAWKRERLCNVRKPTGSKTLSWDLLFFPAIFILQKAKLTL